MWHAKRFHMVHRWGYRLPETSTNKGFRANYRACRSHCLLIDMSYLACIDVTGPEIEILAGLQQCCSTACGLTFAARAYMDGLREGSVAMYHPNAYPYKTIGNVSFVWKPRTSDSNRSLWLWLHPTFHEEVVECLKTVFNLRKNDETDQEAFSVPKWTNNSITMSVLKDKLNRFRLVGPLSSCVIADALTVAPLPKPDYSSADDSVIMLDIDKSVIDVPNTSEIEISIDVEGATSKVKEKRMENAVKNLEEARAALRGLYHQEGWTPSWQQQKDMADRLSSTSPSQFPAGVVLGLLVADPRLSTPPQRTKSTGSAGGNYTLEPQ